MPLRAPGTDARISKAKAMRERENAKQHRERLRTMLMQKLTVKYGQGRQSGANRAIASEVNKFMEGSTTISEPDLIQLEKGIIGRIEASKGEDGPGRPTTASASQLNLQEPGRSGGSRPATAALESSRSGVDKLPWLANTSEWKVLDAYHAIENENHMKKSMAESRKKQNKFKMMLDEQVATKQSKNPSAELQAQDDAYARTQTKLLAEWRDEMVKTKTQIAERHQEEKRVRDMQIAYRKAEKERELKEKRDREERELEDCRMAIEGHKDLITRKKEAARQRREQYSAHA